jgi:hypothetical protein
MERDLRGEVVREQDEVSEKVSKVLGGWVATVRVQGPSATVFALAVEPSCPTREVSRAMTLVVQSAVRRW